MKNQKGFTLIEMLIVLAVISMLLIIMVPNLAEKNSTLQDKGCDALAQMAENQVLAYEIEKSSVLDSVETLVTEDYLKTDKCANDSKKVQFKDDRTIEIVPITNE